ncbi:TetR/AcrR family transcriptional regulator [Rhodococcus sp. 27YEA15]|uniref:TetR/AcrR family transcriptional regulator n=1 Tax=Rhodococcus sp. 27YEA15 TaxID=3156259 RepID=UPI003C7A42DF
MRRPQILASAVEVLRERGLWSVRVQDVAERAGTSAAGVIYYFGTKHALFRAAINFAEDAYYDTVGPELGALETGVERMAWLVVRSSESEWILWMDLWVYARRHPDMLPTHREFNDRWIATVTEVVRHGQLNGEFAGASADAVAERLAALMAGMAIQMVNEAPGWTSEYYIEMALASAAAELDCDLQTLTDEARAVPRAWSRARGQALTVSDPMSMCSDGGGATPRK